MPGGGTDPYGSATAPEIDLTAQGEQQRWKRIVDWIREHFSGGFTFPEFPTGEMPSGSNQGGGTLDLPGYGGTGSPYAPPSGGLPPGAMPPMPGVPPTGFNDPGFGGHTPGAVPQPPMPPQGGPPGRTPPPASGPPLPPGRMSQQPMPPPWMWQGPQQPWQGPQQTVYRGGGPTAPPPWRLF